MIPLHRFLRRLSGLASGAALLVLATASAAGADFSVNPLSVMLDAQARSAQIEIRNHADQPVRFQIRGAGWTQDAAGKNVYGDPEGLIYFPRAMELAPGESRVVRVGVKGVPTSREEAYSVFVEEVPIAGQEAPARGAQIRLLLSVSVPVFVAPLQKLQGGAVEALTLRKGTAEATVVNSGNVHLGARTIVLRGLAADGGERYTHSFTGRYVLPGAGARVEAVIPRDTCLQLTALELVVTTPDKSELKRRIDVARADCQ
jgi:P pilus assembly chaperone PapD